MYKVNLLPDYIEPRAFSKRRILLTSCMVLFLVFLLTSGFFYAQSRALDKQFANVRDQLDKLQPEISRVNSVKKDIQAKQEQYLALSHIINHRLTWDPFLEDLPLALPADTWLNGIEIKKMATIPQNQGMVSSGYKPLPKKPVKAPTAQAAASPEQTAPPVPNVVYLYGSCWTMGSVGVLVDNLCSLPYFTSVELVEAALDRRKGFIQFEIAAKIKGGEWDVAKLPQPQP